MNFEAGRKAWLALLKVGLVKIDRTHRHGPHHRSDTLRVRNDLTYEGHCGPFNTVISGVCGSGFDCGAGSLFHVPFGKPINAHGSTLGSNPSEYQHRRECCR